MKAYVKDTVRTPEKYDGKALCKAMDGLLWYPFTLALLCFVAMLASIVLREWVGAIVFTVTAMLFGTHFMNAVAVHNANPRGVSRKHTRLYIQLPEVRRARR
jgi:hypothetical protein